MPCPTNTELWRGYLELKSTRQRTLHRIATGMWHAFVLQTTAAWSYICAHRCQGLCYAGMQPLSSMGYLSNWWVPCFHVFLFGCSSSCSRIINVFASSKPTMAGLAARLFGACLGPLLLKLGTCTACSVWLGHAYLHGHL